MDEATKAIARVMNQLAMKLMIVETGLQEIARSLPEPLRAETAERFRLRAGEVMQAHAAHLTPDQDEQMTLSVAALLEALGKPPSRN